MDLFFKVYILLMKNGRASVSGFLIIENATSVIINKKARTFIFHQLMWLSSTERQELDKGNDDFYP